MASPATFKINLPSIPGKAIRLRVQDVAKKGFLGREHRFHSDKSKLTSEFTETFDNLHRAQTPPEPEEYEKQSRSTVASYHTESPPVRYVMPEYKNVLMEVLKREQVEMIRAQNGFDDRMKGSSRAISQMVQPLHPQQPYISVEERLWQYRYKQKQRREFVQDYYNIGKKLEDQQRQRIKKLRMQPSAVFLNESRDRIRQRKELCDESLGPGYYPMALEKDEEEELRKQEIKRLSLVRPKQPVKPSMMDESYNLKKQTAKIFVKHQIELNKLHSEQQQAEEPRKPQRRPNEDHMFVKDDRDRFGDQIFPIVLKLNVPGPGAYEVAETIEDKAKKISTLEEQRSLLKEWFNQ